MEKVDLKILSDKLNADLSSQIISGRILLDRLSVVDENSRKSPAYPDHKYAPFYYYLGKYFKAEKVMELGFSLGLLSSSYFTSNKSAEVFFGFREKSLDFASIRIGKRNIKQRFKGDTSFYVGNFFDQEFTEIADLHKWDLIFVNEELSYDKHLEYFDIAWDLLSENGILIMDYIGHHEPAKNAFYSFANSKNRDFVVFDTRYKTGVLQK
jgi:predicted O-methyltransferase YrrM